MRASLLGAVVALALSASSMALASDLADEADLQFRLGATAYQRADYTGALEHFLASNRLVPNKNVVFNIARTYEKLASYPEAFRYYTQALEGETDADARSRITAALASIRPNVAVLEVVTDPPGATIYVDRKDLGPRGASPRTLGLPPGTYTVIVELPGYEPNQTQVDSAKLGSEVKVSLKLKQILGTVRVAGAPGASVHVDDPQAPPAGTAPVELGLAPGHHTLYVERPGSRATAVPVEVAANTVSTVTPALAPLTGTLVVDADEPGARIDVDGRPAGFTPAILDVPAGPHRIRISMKGFHTAERDVVVVHDAERHVDVELANAEQVVAVSRITESLENAPSSVSIVPAQELRAMAYPTIADALRGVRGFYTWNDRSYEAIGVRGLGVLGSYGNRVLVLVDGMPTNDDWIGSSYVGYDGRVDLGDVERIEAVRGPGSVAYGTGAFAGVVNLVTRWRDQPSGGDVGVSTNHYGVARARARATARFGKDAGVWTSVAVAKGAGRDFFFPEYVADTPPEVAGNARNADGFDAGMLQGRIWWRWLTAQWFVNTHTKRYPTGEFDTLLADPRAKQTDTRSFLELKAEPQLTREIGLLTRVHLNNYRFDGGYPRDPADDGLETDTYRGSWIGGEQRITFTPSDALRVMVGGEGQLHFQVHQTGQSDSGVWLDETHPYQVGAAYANADAALGNSVRVSAGARLDAYSTFGSSLNPRAALIVRPYSTGNTKLMAGKAFRAPSVYELYYNDDNSTQRASPDLGPESTYSLELEHTHNFTPAVAGTLATFVNYTKDLVRQDGDGTSTDLLHYVNSPSPVASLGAEVEIRREWRQGWMVSASYSFQHSAYLAGSSLSDLASLKQEPALRHVPNAPEHLAALRGAVPIIGRQVLAATRLTFVGPRWDANDSVTDPEQRKTDAAAVWDLVLSGDEPRWNLGWALGLYNAFDWRYSAPVSREFRQTTIVQEGRTVLASADVRF